MVILEMTRHLIALCAGMISSASSVEAASCAQLMSRGAQIIDSCLMDFGASEKLHVYIVRLPGDGVETCTSSRKLWR